tara:strand:+ start:42958 stop:43788 length:831 start_codon:yes stop_codon:yes gene_type:complete
MSFTLISGPCVIESKELVFEIAEKLQNITNKLGIRYFFKASFDKANRSSGDSFRGLGFQKGLNILNEVRNKYHIPILTDIHESYQAKEVAEIVDVIQIPAYLCRQTDLLKAAANSIEGTDKVINVKKGQFLAPWDMEQVVRKLKSFKVKNYWLTERGTTFGYNSLVVDYRSLIQLKKFNCPVFFDATHSVQQPGGKGNCSGGQREFISPLSRAAIAVGVDGLFMEMHPTPNKALSDGPNMFPLDRAENLLTQLTKLNNITKELNTENSIIENDIIE